MIEEAGGRALAVRCDVTRSEDVQGRAGPGGRGVRAPRRRLQQRRRRAAEPEPTADITEEEWDRIIAINLRGVFLCMKHEIPLMLEQGGGAIVNTSSGAGVKGFAGGAAYVAAKHGVIGLTKCGGARLRGVEHPRQRHLPRHHRHRDDGALQRRHRPRAAQR